MQLKENIYKRGDAYCFTLYKKATQENASSFIGITRTISPSFQEALSLQKYVPSLSVELNLSFFLPSQIPVVYHQQSMIANIKVIKSFDNALLKAGSSWHANKQEGVFINQSMKEKLEIIDHNILNSYLSLKIEKQVHNYVNSQTINDTFLYSQNHRIIGIIDEFAWQNQPTVYLSFNWVSTYLKNHYLYHYSLAKQEVISWYRFIDESAVDSVYRHYSVWLFVDSKEDIVNLLLLFQNLSSSPYILESSVQDNYLLFDSVTQIITWVMEIMIVFIAIIVSATVGYLTTIHLIQDEHELGIIYAFGARSHHIMLIYGLGIFMINAIALGIAVVASWILGSVINVIFSYHFNLAILSFKASGLILSILIAVTNALLLLTTIFVTKGFHKKDVDYLIREI